MSLPAEALFARYREQGKPAFLGQVYDLTAPQLATTALQLTRDHAHAEDLLQATYLMAMERREDWDGQQPLLAWLTEVLVSIEEDVRRSHRPAQSMEQVAEALELVAPEPISQAMAVELDGQLDRALEGMPERYRSVLVLRIKEGMGSQEIAEMLGRSRGTVRSQLARTRTPAHVVPAGGGRGMDLREQARGGLAAEPTAAPNLRVRKALMQAAREVPRKSLLSTGIWALLLIPAVLLLPRLGRWAPQVLQEPRPASQPTALPVAPRRPACGARNFRAAAAGSRARVQPPERSRVARTHRGSSGTAHRWRRGAGGLWREWRTGDPAPQLNPESRFQGYRIQTDEAGRFELGFPMPTATDIVLEVTAGPAWTRVSRWFGQAAFGMAPLRPGIRELPAIRLMPGGELHARVTDSEGRALPWTQVDFFPGQSATTGSTAQTDAQGDIHVPFLIAGEQEILVRHKVQFLQPAPVYVHPGSASGAIDWQIPPATPVTVTVQDADGQTRPGERVLVLYPGYRGGFLPSDELTDASGSVTLQLNRDMRAVLAVQPEQGAPASMQITVGESPMSATLTLPPITRSLALVQDALTKQPVGNLFIRRIDDDALFGGNLPIRNARVEPGAGGWYPIPDLGGGRLRLQADGYETTYLDSADLTAGPPIAMQPARFLSGRVLYQGAPVDGARLELVRGESDSTRALPLAYAQKRFPVGPAVALDWAESDAQGRFRLQVPPIHGDPVRLAVIDGLGHGRLVRAAKLAGLEAVLAGDLELVPTGTIHGRVLLPDGQAPGGLRLNLNHPGSMATCEVAPDGHFVLENVPAGEHYLVIESTLAVFAEGRVEPVTVPEGGVAEAQLDLRDLGRSWPLVQLFDGQRQTLAGWEVGVIALENAHQGEVQTLGRTDATGRCSGGCLVWGAARFVCRESESAEWQETLHDPVRLDLGTGRTELQRVP
ncbi:MAG: sigma-70 family RNA polymerase sigma factor [Planctomycetota bacterium]